MKNSKIVALVATAALLVLGAAFTSMAASYNWYQQDGEWRCKNASGDDYYSEWAKSGADWYWLDDDGWMAREALVDDDTKYVDADGKMVKNQWVKLADDEGNEYWNYFQAGGKKMVGKDDVKPVTVNGKKYIFNQDGKMLSGWVLAGYADAADDDYAWKDGIYYCGDEDDGAVTLGWRQIECYNEEEDFVDNNYWFWFGTNGIKFAATDGATLKEKTINGKGYAFNEYGVMKAEWEAVRATAATATNATVSNYSWFHTVEDGSKFANGWFRVVPTDNLDPDNNEDDTAKWFYAKSGKLACNEIKTINGKKYGFNELGEMVVGLCAYDIDADADVKFVKTGIDDADDLKKYVDDGYDACLIYYFSADEDNDGSMKTGAQTVTVDGDEYNFYFSTKAGSKGIGVTGKQGNKYYYNGKKVAADDSYGDWMFFFAVKDANGNILYVNPAVSKTFKDVDGSVVDGVKIVDSHYVMISKSGSVATSGTKKDGNGYKAKFVKGTGWTVTAE